MPLFDCRVVLVNEDWRFNVDVDEDVGGERRRWDLKLFRGSSESDVWSKFGEICIGCEII